LSPVHGGEVWELGEIPIDFSANINPLGPSKQAIRVLKEWKVEHYPPPHSPELKVKIAKYVGVEEENITVGNGSIEIIKDFCSIFFKKSDTALIAGPTFAEYERFCKAYGGRAPYVLPSFEFGHRPDEIISSVDENTKIIFICRPNNPTGWAIGKDDLVEVIEFASEKDIYVFLDEVFIEFSNLESLAPKALTWENLFVLRSFTKFFALPGLRVGYGVSNPGIIEKLEKIRPPWNINIFAHDAALASIRDSSYFERTKRLIEKERLFLATKISNLGVQVYESNANFLLLRFNWNSREVKEELLKEGLLIRDCSNFFGLDTRFIRVSVRKRKDNQRLIEALKKQTQSGVKKGRECEYFPCHFEGQDCTYCFCPFYPCDDKELGHFISGRKGMPVWSCKDCRWIHEPETVRRIQKILGDGDIYRLSRKKRLEIKKKAIKSA
jgi:L-threonine-O-3-phosphate decarboxylase